MSQVVKTDGKSTRKPTPHNGSDPCDWKPEPANEHREPTMAAMLRDRTSRVIATRFCDCWYATVSGSEGDMAGRSAKTSGKGGGSEEPPQTFYRRRFLLQKLAEGKPQTPPLF